MIFPIMIQIIRIMSSTYSSDYIPQITFNIGGGSQGGKVVFYGHNFFLTLHTFDVCTIENEFNTLIITVPPMPSCPPLQGGLLII